MNLKIIIDANSGGFFDDVWIPCPECASIEDDQYTCTTCWWSGGNGEIRVSDLIDAVKNYF